MNQLFKRKITDVIPLSKMNNNIIKRFKQDKNNNLPIKNKKINDKIYNGNKKHNSKNNQNHNKFSNIQIANENKINNNGLSNNGLDINSLGNSKYHSKHKEPIPKRIREIVWNTYNGDSYSSKCYVSWCDNQINVFNYQVGHDVPESKGGTMDVENLRPICGNCNQSMGNKYTIQEWCKLVETKNNKKRKLDYKDILEEPKDILDELKDIPNAENIKKMKLNDDNINNDTSTHTAKLSLVAVLVLALNLILF